ncbi:MAG: hypothetical protein A3K19_29165 [Lentisphaerae bacterium RIFOXYB12_FULL_65_16]|nr:MAG: hypothetical protein A3K18_04555 [Lentisphaerae bacterium RIFOXYA12_64_32]OGV88369.1 MAG: hypothetical protein A3K19_29165 [Lentisphaerae bacterium RIFOXYB12_FULL_65_16]
MMTSATSSRWMSAELSQAFVDFNTTLASHVERREHFRTRREKFIDAPGAPDRIGRTAEKLTTDLLEILMETGALFEAKQALDKRKITERQTVVNTIKLELDARRQAVVDAAAKAELTSVVDVEKDTKVLALSARLQGVKGDTMSLILNDDVKAANEAAARLRELLTSMVPEL